MLSVRPSHVTKIPRRRRRHRSFQSHISLAATTDHLSHRTKSILSKGLNERSTSATHFVSVTRVGRHHALTADDKELENDDLNGEQYIGSIIARKKTNNQSENTPKSSILTECLVTTSEAAQHQSRANKFGSNLSVDPSVNTTYAWLNRTGSVGEYRDIVYQEKKRKRRKYLGGYYCCSMPLCALFSVLIALLLAIAISALLVGLLIKSKTTTTTTSPIPTTSSTSITTSASSTSMWTTSSSTLSSTTTQIVCGFSCLNQTWISSSRLLAKWAFDGTFLDTMNNYNATALNNPSFITNGYVNQALQFNSVNSQYLYTSYIPLIDASFTIEAWLYPTGFPNPTDHSILGLCTYPGNDQCLHLTIRSISSTQRLYLSFFGDNCLGISSVPLNQWTHAAFVFDNLTRSMSIYLNGILDANATSALPLQGSSTIVTIGYIPGIVAAYGNNFFQGYIDQLTIANWAKPACEILDDATLATYYNFDSTPPPVDSGPNSLLSTSVSVSFVSSGHSSQAISFNDSSSYLQIADLTGLGVVNQSFSISLWIRPYSLSGTFVFISSTAAGSGWCVSFMGFATNGSIVAQLWTGALQAVMGPAVPTSSTWSHVVQTWSSTNGLRLYVNNVLVASLASATSYAASSASNYVKLANRPNNYCALGLIGSIGAYSGAIDDFRIYSREITADDVCALYRS